MKTTNRDTTAVSTPLEGAPDSDDSARLYLEVLQLLEAAHAVVCTFTVENETQDVALSGPAIVKMLRGVDALIGQAQERAGRLPIEGKEWAGSDTRPESWMFNPILTTTVNVDLLNTACIRGRALIGVLVAIGCTDGGFELLSGYDFEHAVWGIEGVIAQAIEIVRIAKPVALELNQVAA